jgi:hypothetical protein
LGGYIPIQVDWYVVQSGRVNWALFSGRLTGIVLLLDLTRGFVLDCGCLYADVCGARTTAISCWWQEVLVTHDRLLSLPYMVILRRSGRGRGRCNPVKADTEKTLPTAVSALPYRRCCNELCQQRSGRRRHIRWSPFSWPTRFIPLHAVG